MFKKQNIFMYILTTFLTAVIIESCSTNEKSETIIDTQAKELNYKLLFNLEEQSVNSIKDAESIIEKFGFILKSVKYFESQNIYMVSGIKKDYSSVSENWDLVTVKFYFNSEKQYIRSEVFREKFESQ